MQRPLSKISVTAPTADRFVPGAGLMFTSTPIRHETSPHFVQTKCGVLIKIAVSVLSPLKSPHVVAELDPR